MTIECFNEQLAIAVAKSLENFRQNPKSALKDSAKEVKNLKKSL